MSQIPPLSASGPSSNYSQGQLPRPGLLTAVGVLSIVLAALTILFAVIGMVSAAAFSTLSRTPMTTTTPAVSAAPAPPTIASGLPAPRGAEALAALVKKHTLTPKRTALLTRLLAREGQNIFPFATDRPMDAVAASSITDSGQANGTDYFIVGSGRVEVTDDDATFRPTGGGDLVTVTAGDEDPAAANAAPLPRTAVRMPVIPKVNATYSMVTGLISLAFGVLMLISGIAVLKDKRSGRSLHLKYAVAKILVELGLVFYVWNVTNEMMASNTSGMSQGAAMIAAVVAVLFGLFFGCVYPVVLLIVLNLQSIKDYSRTLR